MTERRKSNVRKIEEYASKFNGDVLPPNQVIAEAVGLTARQVGSAIAKSRQQTVRVIPKILQYDGTFDRKNAGIMQAKGNIWPEIKPYALLGMRPREVQEALRLESSRDLTQDSINNAFAHRRARGHLPVMALEERDNVSRTVLHATDEEIKVRVRVWLGLRDFVKGIGLETEELKRLDWMMLISLVDLSKKDESEALDFSPVTPFINQRVGASKHRSYQQIAAIINHHLARANNQVFSEPEVLILNLVPPDGIDSRQLELPLLERYPAADFRQISFEQYGEKQRQLLIEQLTNFNLFAAKLANLAKDVGWSPKANFESVARAIREKGINVSVDVQNVVNKVGFAVENTEIGLALTRGLRKPKTEAQISEEEYLRYATYYLILAKFGLTLPDTPTEASRASYKEKVAAVIAKAEVQRLIKYWEITLEKFVAQLRK